MGSVTNMRYANLPVFLKKCDLSEPVQQCWSRRVLRSRCLCWEDEQTFGIPSAGYPPIWSTIMMIIMMMISRMSSNLFVIGPMSFATTSTRSWESGYLSVWVHINLYSSSHVRFSMHWWLIHKWRYHAEESYFNLQHQGLQLSCLISTVPRKFGFFVALYVNVKMPFTRGRPLRQQMMELRAVHALPRPPTLPSSKKICDIESSWIV